MKLPILGTIDERFLTHRLRSTSIGGLAGVLLAGGLFFYNLTHHVIRWDFLAIVATAAVVKISVLIWYRVND
ncbi:MAG TPA: hypothetical protein VGQ65_13835 [Thermoanaerobaculia bacterium]|jgi:hypothetical protein|nr:hypothetical protein [Thermoanaerobaculia bacterium]